MIKIQKGNEDELTIAEEEVMEPLLRIHDKDYDIIPAPIEDEKEEGEHNSFDQVLGQVYQKRKSRLQKESRYNDGIMAVNGVAVEVERLCSMADGINTKRRARMSPLVFECIMYLKFNRDLWDLATVVKANKRRKNEVKEAREEVLKQKFIARRDEIREWENFNSSLDM